MRHWLLRWRIARALDEGRPLRPADARRVAADPGLRRHHAALRSLEEGLVREARAWHLPASDARRLALPERPARARLERARSRVRAPWWPVAAAAGIAALFLVLREPAGDSGGGSEASVALSATSSEASATPADPATDRRPWASLDRLARRTLAVPKAMLSSEREEALVGEAKNVVRDARRLASHLAGHVALVR